MPNRDVFLTGQTGRLHVGMNFLPNGQIIECRMEFGDLVCEIFPSVPGEVDEPPEFEPGTGSSIPVVDLPEPQPPESVTALPGNLDVTIREGVVLVDGEPATTGTHFGLQARTRSSGAEWTAPMAATFADRSNASAGTSGTYTKQLVVQDFGFGLPPGAVPVEAIIRVVGGAASDVSPITDEQINLISCRFDMNPYPFAFLPAANTVGRTTRIYRFDTEATITGTETLHVSSFTACAGNRERAVLQGDGLSGIGVLEEYLWAENAVNAVGTRLIRNASGNEEDFYAEPRCSAANGQSAAFVHYQGNQNVAHYNFSTAAMFGGPSLNSNFGLDQEVVAFGADANAYFFAISFSTNSWAAYDYAQRTLAISNAAAGTLRDRMVGSAFNSTTHGYAAGGQAVVSGLYLTSVVEATLASATIGTTTALDGFRESHGGGCSSPTHGYLFGGIGYSDANGADQTLLDIVRKFEFSGETWSSGTSLPATRQGLYACSATPGGLA